MSKLAIFARISIAASFLNPVYHAGKHQFTWGTGRNHLPPENRFPELVSDQGFLSNQSDVGCEPDNASDVPAPAEQKSIVDRNNHWRPKSGFSSVFVTSTIFLPRGGPLVFPFYPGFDSAVGLPDTPHNKQVNYLEGV